MCICSIFLYSEITKHNLKFKKNVRNLPAIDTVNRFNPGSTRRCCATRYAVWRLPHPCDAALTAS